MDRRSHAIDSLRGVAILLVLLHHQSFVLTATHDISWSGVDLFFVLSGYLVTGLLLREQAKYGATDVSRFLIRRGFKIYPAFWVMIAATVVFSFAAQRPVSGKAMLFELVFLQNYGPGLWASTWSLAVEEHFYFAIALLFIYLNHRRGPLDVRTVTRWALFALVAVLASRCLTVATIPTHYKLTYWGTHVRVDALICGALIAFWQMNARRQLAAFVTGHSFQIAFASVVLLAISFATYHIEPVRMTIGFTLTYLAYAGVLLLVLHHAEPDGLVTRVLAGIGRYSYGIYIWHLPLLALILPLVKKKLGISETIPGSPALTYFFEAIVGGIALSQAIEFPFLRLRDRWFPSRAGIPAQVHAQGAPWRPFGRRTGARSNRGNLA